MSGVVPIITLRAVCRRDLLGSCWCHTVHWAAGDLYAERFEW